VGGEPIQIHQEMAGEGSAGKKTAVGNIAQKRGNNVGLEDKKKCRGHHKKAHVHSRQWNLHAGQEMGVK